MGTTLFACLGDARFHAIPQDIALEFRKHGEHAGEGSSAGGRHVESLCQRHEADTDGM